MNTSTENASTAPNPVDEQESTGLPQAWWQRAAELMWLVRSLTNFCLAIAAFAFGVAMLGVAQRQGWLPTTPGSVASAPDAAASASSRYICPMMCVPPTSVPGTCPVCGMDLVAASGGGSAGGSTIEIDPAARRLVGIRTEPASSGSINRVLRTVGSIDFDQSLLATISAYVDGRIEAMYADYVGVPIEPGDNLAMLYSPQLFTAQTEYVSALDNPGNSRFVDNSRFLKLATENLTELGMTPEQITALKSTQTPQPRVRVTSPQKGTVIAKLAIEGDYLKTGQPIYRIADLSTVWMMLDLFPDDAALIRFGQRVEAEIASAPGETFSGRVAFIDPTVNEKTRTVRVRVELPNPSGKLRPGDYATARVTVPAVPQQQSYDPVLAGKFISPMHPRIVRDAPGLCPICDMELIPTSQLGFASSPLPEPQTVTVPRSAVLMAGNNSVVYVETTPGRFQVRKIALGALTDTHAIVASGVVAGEQVAIDGNFLLDSQSQLAGNPSLLDPSKAPTGPDQAGRDSTAEPTNTTDDPFTDLEVLPLDFAPGAASTDDSASNPLFRPNAGGERGDGSDPFEGLEMQPLEID